MITRLRAKMLTSDLCRGERVSSGAVALARETGLLQKWISHYANGDLPIPIPHLYAIAEALDCEPYELIGWVSLPTVVSTPL